MAETYTFMGSGSPVRNQDGALVVTQDGAARQSDAAANAAAINAGASSVAVSQVAASTTAATLVIARPTRRGVTIRNHAASIAGYIGPATGTAANGLLLKAGESIYVTWVGLIQVIAASGTPAVGVWDEYA